MVNFVTAQALLGTGPFRPFSDSNAKFDQPRINAEEAARLEEHIDSQVRDLNLVLQVAKRRQPLDVLVNRLSKLEAQQSYSEGYEIAKQILEADIAVTRAYYAANRETN